MVLRETQVLERVEVATIAARANCLSCGEERTRRTPEEGKMVGTVIFAIIKLFATTAIPSNP